MQADGPILVADAALSWVQELDPQHATQALLTFGLWSPRDGAAPTDTLDAAYQLAERTLRVERQAITFHAEGSQIVCSFVYAERAISASAEEQALALTRAILRAAYEARLL